MIPTFTTSETKPSWLNRAGRIDRSACVELKASDLWRLCPSGDWKRRALRPHRGTYLLAQTTWTLTAHRLTNLHDDRVPFILRGDFRTTRSNAMKHAPYNTRPREMRGHTIRSTRAVHPADTAIGLGAANPNRGASRSKSLGIPDDWRQTLTLQRWRLHDRLSQHFFVCPGCGRRALKLFLPLCTQDELRDAGFARLWLRSHRPYLERLHRLRPQADRLSARYGLLFHPRRMLCRKCLDLRYGELRRDQVAPPVPGPALSRVGTHFQQPLRGRKVYHHPLLISTPRSRRRRRRKISD